MFVHLILGCPERRGIFIEDAPGSEWVLCPPSLGREPSIRIGQDVSLATVERVVEGLASWIARGGSPTDLGELFRRRPDHAGSMHKSMTPLAVSARDNLATKGMAETHLVPYSGTL
jgi:hypothetical protein